MCLLVVLSRVVPGLPLIVAANRDERRDRPATPMTVLRALDPRTLGGRDEKAGGTWLAVNEAGVVAGLTNRPTGAERDDSKRSRGELALALTTRATAGASVEDGIAHLRPELYNPSWLLVGDRHSLYGVDMTAGEHPAVVCLPAGVHVLENKPLGEAGPKTHRVRWLLNGIDQLAPVDAIERMWRVIADHEVPPQPPAPEPPPEPDPDAPKPRPPAVDAPCVHIDDEYGTRWSAMIAVADDPGTRPAFWYTDGPSCTAPRLDATPLWDA